MKYRLILEDETLQKNFGKHLDEIETDYRLEVGEIVVIGECSYCSTFRKFKTNEQLLKGQFTITAKYHIPDNEKLFAKVFLKQIEKPKDLSPAEKWLLETIEDAESITQPNGDVVWWFKDGDWLFKQDFKKRYLWVSSPNIGLPLHMVFGLSIPEAEELLAKLLYDYTDNGNLKITF